MQTLKQDIDDDFESYRYNLRDQDATIPVQSLKKDFFHGTTQKLTSSDHTRRTSISSSSACSSDWLVDDLEELLNDAVHDDINGMNPLTESVETSL
jgi:hypothetical protein